MCDDISTSKVPALYRKQDPFVYKYVAIIFTVGGRRVHNSTGWLACLDKFSTSTTRNVWDIAACKPTYGVGEQLVRSGYVYGRIKRHTFLVCSYTVYIVLPHTDGAPAYMIQGAS